MGGLQVTRSVDRWRRPATAAALMAVLALMAIGLSACGRKGMLDQPPSANLPQPQQSYTPRPSLGEEGDLAPQTGSERPPRPQAAAAPATTAATTQPPRTFFLDFLIGK
jgi:predicted small lipoprotein YifL